MVDKCPAAGYLREALEIADRIIGTPLDYAVPAPLTYPSQAEMERASVLAGLAAVVIALTDAKLRHDPRAPVLLFQAQELCRLLDGMPDPKAAGL